MRALTLAVLKVLRLDEVDTSTSPLLGVRGGVFNVNLVRSAADPLRVDARSREMNRQLVAMGERIALVMMRGTEAQLLIVGNGPRYIRDHEDRLDTDHAWHSESIKRRRLLAHHARLKRRQQTGFSA
jgi:serine/threonine protein phosphatase PrpC